MTPMTSPIAPHAPAAPVHPGRGRVAPEGPAPTGTGSGNAVVEWSRAGTLRPTADHLDLVRALIEAGQFGRAGELLDAVWHHDLPDESAWYLRLWLLVGQGRVLESLEMARLAGPRFPGSAAVAYLQAVLEQAVGSPMAAVESALRAVAVVPGHPGAEQLLVALTRGAEERAGHSMRVTLPAQPGEAAPSPNAVPTLWTAALQGAALLLPFGSAEPLRPALPPGSRISGPNLTPAPRIADLRRRWLLVILVVVFGLAALRDPLLGGVALALTVGWLALPAPARSFPG